VRARPLFISLILVQLLTINVWYFFRNNQCMENTYSSD